MKKVLLAALIGLFLSNVLQAQVEKAFDFSDVCSSGQTLYYKILSDHSKGLYQIPITTNAVEVTYPYLEYFKYPAPYSGGSYEWGYKGYTKPIGNVAIPSKVSNNGITYTIVLIHSSAFEGCENIESITIPSTVILIGSEAFKNCSGLKSVSIPNSVKEIEWKAFYACSSLQSINIPASVKKIGHGTFQASGLRSIKFPNAITSLGDHICSSCKNLESVVLPTNTKAIYFSSFSGCSALKSITLPNTVTEIEHDAFNGCYCLQIKVPSTVTKVGYNAFCDCLNIVYHGKLEEAPWGAKCLNGYVEGGCVYKDKTKKTLVAYSKEEEERRQEIARAEQERQKLAERNNRASQVNVGNVMSYVKSFELMDNSPSRTSYHVNFYGVSNNYSSSIIYHSGHWWYYYHDDTFMANPDSKEGAILGLWKHFNDIGLFD